MSSCKERKTVERCIGFFLLITFVFWTLRVPWGEAVWVDLTPEQIQEAIRWGKENLKERLQKGLPIDGNDKEWEVDLGEGKGKAYLHTPFERISFQARHFAGIQMELPEREINNMLFMTQGKLIFELTLYGKQRYFSRKYRVRLQVGEASIEPMWTDRFKGVSSGLKDSELAFKATYIAHFSLEGIDPQSQVTVVASGREQQEVHFPFDLSKMR